MHSSPHNPALSLWIFRARKTFCSSFEETNINRQKQKHIAQRNQPKTSQTHYDGYVHLRTYTDTDLHACRDTSACIQMRHACMDHFVYHRRDVLYVDAQMPAERSSLSPSLFLLPQRKKKRKEDEKMRVKPVTEREKKRTPTHRHAHTNMEDVWYVNEKHSLESADSARGREKEETLEGERQRRGYSFTSSNAGVYKEAEHRRERHPQTYMDHICRLQHTQTRRRMSSLSRDREEGSINTRRWTCLDPCTCMYL